MFKMIALIPRKPGMTREEFIDYYENSHVPLILSHFRHMRRYLRNYPQGENVHYAGRETSPEVCYDAVMEQWFDSRADYEAMIDHFDKNPEIARAVAEDEERFCDKSRILMFAVEECESAL